MNVFQKISWQGLVKNRTRTLVTIAGVVLSAAMVTAVLTFGVSLLRYMTNGAMAKYGDWHAAFWNVDAAFAAQRASDDEVAKTATVENIGYARLEDGRNAKRPYFYLAGYSDEAFSMLPITLFSGRLPQNGSEVLVSGKVAADAGVRLAVGDSLTLTIGQRRNDGRTLGQNDPYESGEALTTSGVKTYAVVGVCQTPRYEPDDAPGYALITHGEPESAADSLNLFVSLKDPRQVRAYIARNDGGNGSVMNDAVLRFLGVSDNRLFNSLLYAVGGIVVAIIMIGSIFLIYNAFSISLNERTQQLGILMSVGATARQLRNAVLFEGLCVGAAGIPIGLAAGVGCTRLLIDLVARNFGNVLYTNVPLTLTVEAPALLGAAVVSMITILLSASIPARKAVRMPVMECIRQTNELKTEAKAIRTTPLARRVYGLEGMLALKNAKRNRKRYRSIVLSLVLSVVLFVSAGAFVTDMRQLSGQSAEVTTYDIALVTNDMAAEEALSLFELLKTADGITESIYQETASFSCQVPAEKVSEAYKAYAGLDASRETVTLPVRLQFLDDAAYMKIVSELGLALVDFTGENGKLLAVAQWEQGEAYADLFTAPDVDALLRPDTEGNGEQFPGKSASIACVFTVPPDTLPVTDAAEPSPVLFQAMVPYSLKTAFLPADATVDSRGMTFRSDTPAQTTAEMETLIQGAGVTVPYGLYNLNRLMDETRNYVFIVNVFAYSFIVMISLIAVANVFNTVSTNIKMRRRELAMLRSVGMSERAFQRMMNFECAFYGLRALLVGIPMAVGCAYLIYKGMFIGGAEGIVFKLPWVSLLVSVAGVLLIVFVTMLYAVGTIKKENIIDALRDDMT